MMKSGYAYIVVCCAEQSAVARDCDAGNRHVLLGDQLVRACVLGQVPKPDAPCSVAANDLALVRVDDHVVCRGAMVIAPLYCAGPCLPDLDGAVFGACHHPFSLAVKGDACDIAGMTLKDKMWCRVGIPDFKELDCVVAGGGKISLVGGDAEAVHLRVWVLDRSRADARKGLPKPDGMVITSCARHRRSARRPRLRHPRGWGVVLQRMEGGLPVHRMTDIIECLRAHYGAAAITQDYTGDGDLWRCRGCMFMENPAES